MHTDNEPREELYQWPLNILVTLVSSGVYAVPPIPTTPLLQCLGKLDVRCPDFGDSTWPDWSPCFG